MSIIPSSVTLNSFVSPSGSIPGNILSDTAYPFPDLQSLSTSLAPPLNRSAAPSFYHSSPALASTMLPPDVLYPYHLTSLGGIVLSSPSSPSSSAALDSPRPTTDTGTTEGTSLPSSSTISSNSYVSAPPTSWSAASGISLSSTISSSSSCSHPATSPPTSGFSFTPTPTLPFPISPTTQTPSFSGTVYSHSSFYSTSLPLSSSLVPTSSKLPSTPSNPSTGPDSTTTVVFSTTLVTSISFPSSSLNFPSTSTYTVTSVLLGQGGTTTDFVTTSSVLSTEPPGGTVNSTVALSPGTIMAIVLGIVGAFAFSALWLFCARRRHRELVREAELILPENHASGPLDDEILELGYGTANTHTADNPTNHTGSLMEERYAGIIAALNSTDGFGRGTEGGSIGGVYGSRHDVTDAEGDDNIIRASSPTLPLHVLPPDDPPYVIPLSPPPPVSHPLFHQPMQPIPPPTSYYMASRRKSSPGPDVATWSGGYSVAPSYSSHYARSQTLGSGSGSGSVDALTRTWTGSEEPLLGIGKVTPEMSSGASTPGGISPTTATDPGSNRLGLGSAFGSPATSMYSPSGIYPAFQYDTSGSHDVQTASGSGSYGYAHSGTPSSFDVLRSVSSQGALSSAYSQGHGQSHGFRFGFSRPGSLSSGSTGKKRGSNRHGFGVPPTSFKVWKDRGSAASDKEKQGGRQSVREKDRKSRPQSWVSTSAAGSADEKQGRGSPVVSVRALLERFRRVGHTPSPHSSNKDLSSPTQASVDVDLEKATVDRVTPPPIQIEAATPQRRRFSFILSNPDPYPPSPPPGENVMPSPAAPLRQDPGPIQYAVLPCEPDDLKGSTPFSPGLQPATLPAEYVLVPAPSPAPTEESRLAEGLLHPRLRTQGCSDASLRDFEDYSRPIGGVVNNRMHSTTTFGTQDEIDRSPSQGTPMQDVVTGDENEEVDVFGASRLSGVPLDSWFVDGTSSSTTSRHSPVLG